MSVQAMGWVLEQPISPGPKLVLVSIANHADRLGSGAFIEQANIAIESTMGERTVRRHVEWLEDHGLIVRYRRGRRDGTGRSSDGYEIPGVRGETAEQTRARLWAEGRAVIEPRNPVDGDTQPANVAGSDPDDSETSTGQIRHLNRPDSTAEPATGGRGTVPNRPEPREEEARVASFEAVVDRLDHADATRLQADPGADRLRTALALLEAHGWPPTAIAASLTANPLRNRHGEPVETIAGTLRYRAFKLPLTDPPRRNHAQPVPDCLRCDGTGWVAGDDARGGAPEIRPCTCRTDQETA